MPTQAAPSGAIDLESFDDALCGPYVADVRTDKTLIVVRSYDGEGGSTVAEIQKGFAAYSPATARLLSAAPALLALARQQEAENKRLRAALEKVRDYQAHLPGHTEMGSALDWAEEIARRALAGKE